MIYFLLILGISAISFLCIVGIFTITWERNNKIKKLRENLSYFPPDKLLDRLQTYKFESKISEKLGDLEQRVLELSTKDHIRIMKMLDNMKILASPIKVFLFFKFRKYYLRAFELISDYEYKYLDVRFELFDLTSDIEIEKAILNKIKDQMTHVIESIVNSPIDRIRTSKKLEGKYNRLRSAVSKLEKLIDEQERHLSKEFIESEEKISSTIKSIASDVDFMNEHIKHLDEDLNVPLTNIVETYTKHKAVLTELKPQVNTYISSINKLKAAINEDIDNLKIKDANANMENLDKAINELHLLINANVDYAEFNYSNDSIPSKLLNFVKSNHGMIISEIKRHRLQNEQTRLLYVDGALGELEDSINKFEMEKLNQLNKHAPHGIHRLLMNTIVSYQNYIKVVIDNVRDISQVNESTNEVNNIIAKMNTSLLQVEYNINSLDGLYREQFEKDKEKLQAKVKILRDSFRENTKIVDNKSYEIINKITKQVEELVERSKGAAFEVSFLKETIMYINRFKGSNNKLDLMIESVSESFNDEKYSEALRKAKEIIEIYGIK